MAVGNEVLMMTVVAISVIRDNCFINMVPTEGVEAKLMMSNGLREFAWTRVVPHEHTRCCTFAN